MMATVLVHFKSWWGIVQFRAGFDVCAGALLALARQETLQARLQATLHYQSRLEENSHVDVGVGLALRHW
jgi:hypothetical protein